MQVIELMLTGAEVKRSRSHVPTKIAVNINIEKLTPRDANTVVADFTYAISYLPDVATVKVFGMAHCKDTAENIKKVLAEHKKTKVVPMDLGATLLNMVNANAGLNSIFLIRPFNLLPPFMPPLISTGVPMSARQGAPARPQVQPRASPATRATVPRKKK